MIPASRILAPGPSRIGRGSLLILTRHVHQPSTIEVDPNAKSKSEHYPEGTAKPPRLRPKWGGPLSGNGKQTEYRSASKSSYNLDPGDDIREGRSFKQIGRRRTGNLLGPRETMDSDVLSITANEQAEDKPSGFDRKSGENFPPRSQWKSKYTNTVAKQSAIRPVVQSARVQDLAGQGKFDEAIELIYTAPRFTLNCSTWNTLLKVLMDAGKRKEAYKVYTEMKRRGFGPLGMTFSTMLRGFAAIRDWSAESNMLERSEKVFEDSMQYVQKCIAKNNVDPRLIIPFNCYISLLGRAGQWQKAVDVYYNLENLKPLVADEFTYSTLFDGLAQRKASDRKGELSIAEQNAADAKFFWRRMEKERETGKVKVDALLMRKFLVLLPHGRPADHLFGLEAIRDYVGLVAPGETAPKPCVVMDQYLLNTIMEFCNKIKKPRLCIAFYRQVSEMQRSSPSDTYGLSLSTIYVINQVLTAQAQLTTTSGSGESTSAIAMLRRSCEKRSELQLSRSRSIAAESGREERLETLLPPDTILLALIVCWRCADWASALEVLSLGARTPVDDLVSPSAGKPRIPNARLGLDYSAFSYLARTALECGDIEGMRQFLHIASTWRVAQQSEDSKRFYPYYRTQYHAAVVKIIDAVRADNSKKAARGEEVKEGEAYDSLMNECNEWGAKAHGSPHAPQHEYNVFDSAQSITKLTQAIDFEMAIRNQ